MNDKQFLVGDKIYIPIEATKVFTNTRYQVGVVTGLDNPRIEISISDTVTKLPTSIGEYEKIIKHSHPTRTVARHLCKLNI